jgi:hypothetical protein
MSMHEATTAEQQPPAEQGALTLCLLRACAELVRRQGELAGLLAETLGVPRAELAHSWWRRQCRQHGELKQGEWSYFFHGLECDLTHRTDGRVVRLDFGPGGRLDTFTGWGVLQFIMTTKAPWPEFRELKDQFAAGPPPFDRSSGSLAKFGPWFDRLEAQGLIATVAPELCQLVAAHTHDNAEGLPVLALPPGLPAHVYEDVSVCNRKVISAQGYQLLAEAEHSGS